jgi:CRISPR/Cas system-associated endoribonuclease Cas2
MGLDMYLLATAKGPSDLPPEHHTMFPGYGNRPGNATDGYFEARRLADELHLPPDNANQGNYGFTLLKRAARDGHVKVTVHAGYWRKANHIHKWFVDKVQNGVDECQEAPVTIEQLKQLKADCEKVLEASKLVVGTIRNGQTAEGCKDNLESGKLIADPEVAAEILPTTQGFFFGGDDYDEWYYQDTQHTIEVVDACIAAHEANPAITFAYQSSW